MSSPKSKARVYKQEFLDKINEHSARYYSEENPNEYNFKRRFLKAKKIPASFVKEDEEGGYTVLAQSLHRRFKPRYHYHVYKTGFGYWICTCVDFTYFMPRPCKHIIRTVLFEHGFNQEHDRKLEARVSLCFSDEFRNLECVIDI